MIEQLSLLSHGLEPLQLSQRVWVIAEGWDGVIAQVWPGRDWYAVFAFGQGAIDKALPTFRRDELDALPLLDQVRTIQAEVNAAARAQNRPEVHILSDEEATRIDQLIAANTWPELWKGNEVRGDELVDVVLAEGVVQPLLFALENDL